MCVHVEYFVLGGLVYGVNRTNLATVEDSPHDSTSLDANGKQ